MHVSFICFPNETNIMLYAYWGLALYTLLLQELLEIMHVERVPALRVLERNTKYSEYQYTSYNRNLVEYFMILIPIKKSRNSH